MKIKVGILGATGYTGAELLRLLVSHPKVEVSWLTSETFSGKGISDVFPQFRGFLDLKCRSAATLPEFERADAVFSCLPHGASMRFAGKILDTGARLIDFSADFRLKDSLIYRKFYKSAHAAESLIRDAVYGLPEINRAAIKNARLTANPGCYATGAILGLLPLLAEGILEGAPVIDAKAGITGGGRAPSLQHNFAEINEAAALSGDIGGHNQKPEIEQLMANLGVSPAKIVFAAHRIPANRGILTTIYARIKHAGVNLRDLYLRHYAGEPFIRICEEGKLPDTKSVRYSNFCDIALGAQDDTFIILTALDNLGKGAAAQAAQNMNLMFGFDETEGLQRGGMFP